MESILIHTWRPWKLANFQDPPTSLVQLRPKFFHPLDFQTPNFKRNSLPLPLQIMTNQLKENIIQGWLLHDIRSFLQVGFCSQYQLTNLVWLSIDFYLFSWNQHRSQSFFKKLKTSFSPSCYSEMMCWGQGWSEASLSAFFVALYSCMCSCPKISQNDFYL